jgi:hypothetical protein
MVFDREMRKLNNQMSDIQARCEHTDVLESDKQDYREYCAICRVCGLESARRIFSDPERAKEVKAIQSRPHCGGR